MHINFPVFVKSNNNNSNDIGNVRVTQEVLDKDTRRFRLYLNDDLITTKHIER